MKKNKLFAPFLMLLAGAIASIMMYYFHYSARQLLINLLLVLVVFYLIGFFIQKKVTSFMEQIKAEEAKEGEVIEKKVSEDAEEDTEDAVEGKKILQTEDAAQNTK